MTRGQCLQPVVQHVCCRGEGEDEEEEDEHEHLLGVSRSPLRREEYGAHQRPLARLEGCAHHHAQRGALLRRLQRARLRPTGVLQQLGAREQ